MAVNTKSKNSGFIFLEILIAIALISIVFIFLLSIGVNAIKISFSLENSSKVDSLIKESIEGARSFRDATSWATNGLGAVNTGSSNSYYFSLDSSANPVRLKLNSGQEIVGQFTRKIIFDKVSRDPSTGSIESSYNASNDDPNTRKITAVVISNNATFQTVAYLTNWR